jgi:lactate dehydrogenase-like 2-hydroxyacid dehydrogenase
VKKIILVTDVVKELSVEKKFLYNYNLVLKKITKLDLKTLSNIQGIITGHEISFDKVLISKLPNCKAIVRYGVGYNNIDLNFAKKKGIRVFNVPDYGSNEVADVALGMTMSFLKNLNFYYFNILSKKKNFWNYKNGLIHRRLTQINAGVIGLGRIGSSFARRAKLLGLNVYFYDPYVKELNEKIKKIKSLKKIFDICDVITLHVPSTKRTKFFITDSLIKHAKKNLIIINTARGDLIKENTIIKNIKNGKIMYYGSDVFENEPINFNSKIYRLIKNKKFSSRIIFTPHSAFYTRESFYDLRSKAAKTMFLFLKRGVLKNCVNL